MFEVIENDHSKNYYFDSKLHRLDGPAIIWSDDSEEWWQNGLRHRDDGQLLFIKMAVQNGG